MNKLVIILMLVLIAYGCKKKEVIPGDRPWNEQFVGTYVGKMTYRSFQPTDVGPWMTKDTFITIGAYGNYSDYNTTSLQHIPSIRFTYSGGINYLPNPPATFRFEKNFKNENQYLYYNGKTAKGAGLEIEFYGVRTP